ncbi:hypothetical protein ACFWHQ_21705 [Streptomyces sp. NPDC060334]|uniref:hypothetical protein n=1 Tax=Streptomyces sp. NPDC060334 TaxID=3347099 RepID=UPI00366A54B0
MVLAPVEVIAVGVDPAREDLFPDGGEPNTEARVFVCVMDDEAGNPLPAELPEMSTTGQSGRGLRLIAEYAEGWDVIQGNGPYKTVWFSLAVENRAGTSEASR